MKTEYDFSNGSRGALIESKGKTRITIYLDDVVLENFRKRAAKEGRGYQTLINEALSNPAFVHIPARQERTRAKEVSLADLGENLRRSVADIQGIAAMLEGHTTKALRSTLRVGSKTKPGENVFHHGASSAAPRPTRPKAKS